jgi:hypothetical protein
MEAGRRVETLHIAAVAPDAEQPSETVEVGEDFVEGGQRGGSSVVQAVSRSSDPSSRAHVRPASPRAASPRRTPSGGRPSMRAAATDANDLTARSSPESPPMSRCWSRAFIDDAQRVGLCK